MRPRYHRGPSVLRRRPTPGVTLLLAAGPGGRVDGVAARALLRWPGHLPAGAGGSPPRRGRTAGGRLPSRGPGRAGGHVGSPGGLQRGIRSRLLSVGAWTGSPAPRPARTPGPVQTSGRAAGPPAGRGAARPPRRRRPPSAGRRAPARWWPTGCGDSAHHQSQSEQQAGTGHAHPQGREGPGVVGDGPGVAGQHEQREHHDGGRARRAGRQAREAASEEPAEARASPSRTSRTSTTTTTAGSRQRCTRSMRAQ